MLTHLANSGVQPPLLCRPSRASMTSHPGSLTTRKCYAGKNSLGWRRRRPRAGVVPLVISATMNFPPNTSHGRSPGSGKGSGKGTSAIHLFLWAAARPQSTAEGGLATPVPALIVLIPWLLRVVVGIQCLLTLAIVILVIVIKVVIVVIALSPSVVAYTDGRIARRR